MIASLISPTGWGEAFAQAGIVGVLSCWITLLIIRCGRR